MYNPNLNFKRKDKARNKNRKMRKEQGLCIYILIFNLLLIKKVPHLV
jgi:hypothetical protein